MPAPQLVEPSTETFTLTRRTSIRTEPASRAAAHVGRMLATTLRAETGYPLPVEPATAGAAPGAVDLLLRGADARVGSLGYQLHVTGRRVVVRAHTPSGLFDGVQTLMQLLPARVASRPPRAGAWTVPGGFIVDNPRYGYRGAMLDVARHFFTVRQVERFIDEVSAYKFDYLHLHLTDDQGWRIDIKGWPRLVTVGGTAEIGGGRAGYYTQAQYRRIVRYAAARYVTVVPEIDLPSHMRAALTAYPALGCDDERSELCPEGRLARSLIDDVIGQVAALTPGPFLHIGGDEPRTLSRADYRRIVGHAIAKVRGAGKTVIGWNDAVLEATLPRTTVVQYWKPTTVRSRGNGLIVSDNRCYYLNYRYDRHTPSWGYRAHTTLPLRRVFSCDPESYAAYGAVRGVEFELWSENLAAPRQVEYMTFPRALAVAEAGWSTPPRRSWQDFRRRVAAQAPRWDRSGIRYFGAPGVPWPAAGRSPSGTTATTA